MMYNYKETITSTYIRAQFCIKAFVYNFRPREEYLKGANCGDTHKNNVSLYSNAYAKKKLYFIEEIDNHSSRSVIKQTYFVQLDIN